TPATAGGRLAGTARLSRFTEGVAVTPTLSGAAPEVQLSVDTRSLPAGQTFRADLLLETNAGTFTLPVRFRVALPWRPVVSGALRGAAAWGVGLGLGRLALALAVGPQTWLSQSPTRPEGLAAAWLVVIGVWAAVAISTGGVRRALGARVNTWAGVKWLLLSLGLGCSGLLVVLSGLGTGLLWALDRIGQSLLAPLLPVGAWVVLGVVLGLGYGSASGMIRAGRPRTGVALHWLSVGITLLLAIWGWLTAR
ncbi:MAG: hypothetical protein K0Q72_5354, partial [Armatimonadetes bacterium]|nr:hypothetical protein [Armatimonadota bacterium]